MQMTKTQERDTQGNSAAETVKRIREWRLEEIERTGGRSLRELAEETSRRVREARTTKSSRAHRT